MVSYWKKFAGKGITFSHFFDREKEKYIILAYANVIKIRASNILNYFSRMSHNRNVDILEYNLDLCTANLMLMVIRECSVFKWISPAKSVGGLWKFSKTPFFLKIFKDPLFVVEIFRDPPWKNWICLKHHI